MENYDRKDQFDCTKETLQEYRCSCGNFQTNFLVVLNQHLQENHKIEIEPFFCIYTCACSLETYSEYVILRHKCLFVKHKNPFVPDDTITEKSKCLTTKLKHDLSENSVNKHYRCDRCNYKARWKCKLNRHVLRRHVFLSETEWPQCKQCQRKFRLEEDLKKHAKMIHPEKVPHFQCEHCNFGTKNRWCLAAHIYRKHTEVSENQWHQCDQCPKKFKMKNNLRGHIREMHSKKPLFKCEHCNFKTKKRYSLSTHVLRHHTSLSETELHGCKQCSKKYKVKQDLEQHMRTRHCKERLKCKHCNYETEKRHNLTEHITRKHTKLSEIDWHQCDQCAKKFKVKRALQQHCLSMHCEQGYKCEHCGYKTTQNHLLTSHILRKHASVSEENGINVNNVQENSK